ncbi:MAG TPA: hypothetical protein DDW52_24295 [Planctomycetaceae bacterium]|nr:hypothetical protein [Planctomycetaceae bacterium]
MNTDQHSVTILDSAMQPISATFASVDDDFDCTGSLRSNRFAMGFWNSADLSLFDLTSGDLQATFPFREIGPLVTFDESGTRLLFKTGPQVVLLDVESSEATQVKGVRALDRLVIAKDEVIVPSQKKDELLRVSLQTGDVVTVSLPFKATLFDLKPSPIDPHLIAIDRRKGIHCIDRSDWSIIWSKSFKQVLGKHHMGVGQFSGDGKLFGAAVSAYDHSYTIVIDSHTGKQLNRLESLCYGLPHCGTMVRDSFTRKDSFVAKTLDLETGEESTMTLVARDG